jgi:hypothetical protein
MNCGLILWECKNAKTYQASWLGKLKDELAVEKAQIGLLSSILPTAVETISSSLQRTFGL